MLIVGCKLVDKIRRSVFSPAAYMLFTEDANPAFTEMVGLFDERNLWNLETNSTELFNGLDRMKIKT